MYEKQREREREKERERGADLRYFSKLNFMSAYTFDAHKNDKAR